MKLRTLNRCYKRGYRSQAKANKAMRLHGRQAGCIRIYKCKRHYGKAQWHLTHGQGDDETARNGDAEES